MRQGLPPSRTFRSAASYKVEVWENTRLTFSYFRPVAHTELRKLCHVVVAAAEKETDERTKQALTARAFALAQEAEASERLRLAKDPLMEKTGTKPMSGIRLN